MQRIHWRAKWMAAISLALSCSAVYAADWLQWRGPQGTGQTEIKSAPLEWSKDQNVKWRVELDGQGNSSPIVVGSRVFITHAPKGNQFRGLRCYDRQTGDQVWKHEVEYAEKEPTHGTNPYCAASPVSDGERVVAWYGSAGVYCYDLEGKVLWQKDLGKVEHIWGYGSSPIIHDKLVVLNYGPGLNSFVIALDKTTGEQVWRKDYPSMTSEKPEDFRGSWSTPIVYREGNRDVMLLSLPEKLWAVDPLTGEEIWSSAGLGKLVYTSPLVAGDVIIAMSGYHGPAIAVRAGGSGDVTEDNRLWVQSQRNPQRVGSGVIVGDYLYILNADGVAWCLDPVTGDKKWEERVGGGESWCSMVNAAGRIYISNTRGTTYVLEPSPDECKVLAENELGELTRASPAFSDGQIFIRTYQALYCIEDANKE